MGRLALMWVLLSVVLCGVVPAAETAAPSASPQAPPPPPSPAPFPLEWVRLIPTETLNALWDKESKITNRLVPKPEWWSSLEPLQSQVVIREEPDENAKSLGAIRMVLTSPKISPEFLPPDAAQPIPFTPDLFLDGNIGKHDSFNGNPPVHPWCHQTVMRREGDWVQLPPRPWPKAGWVNIKTSGLVVRSLSPCSSFGTGCAVPYELDGNPIDIFGRTDNGLCARPAGIYSFCNYLDDFQKFRDKGFFDGDTLVAVSEIPWKNLVDPDGRLRLKLATKPELEQNVKRLPHPNFGWIGLCNPDWVDWLEYNQQNLIAPECDRLPPEEYANCVERVVNQKHLRKDCELPVHESPDSASPRLGTIIMWATDNLHVGFRAEGEDKPVEFLPDEVDPDWGYGLHFHQTYLDKQGTWYKLPAKPLPKPGWINMAAVTDKPNDRSQILGVYRGMAQNIVVLGFAADGSGLCVRNENDWDYGCGAEFAENRGGLDKVRVIPWKDLLDKDGHLILHVAYTRGC